MATYNGMAWETWNSSSTCTTGGTTSNDITWRTWNNSSGTLDYMAVDMGGTSNPIVYASMPETDEERNERQRLYRESQRKKKIADRKAETLLLSMLNDEQKEQYETNKSFIVRVCDINYRISSARSYGVTRLGEDGKAVEKLCAHVKQNVPAADNQLAVMLHLCNDHEGYVALANRWQM